MRRVALRAFVGVVACAAGAASVGAVVLGGDGIERLLLATALAALSLGVFFVFFVLYRSVHTQPLRLEYGDTSVMQPLPSFGTGTVAPPTAAAASDATLNTTEVMKRLTNISKNASGGALAFLAQLMLDPRQHIERVTDNAIQMHAGFEVSTTYTVRIPAALGATPLWFPARFQKKGELADGLKIFDSDDARVSSLPQVERTALMLALFRYLAIASIRGPRRRGALDRYARHVEPSVLAFLTGAPGGSLAAARDAMAAFVSDPASAAAAAALLPMLEDEYPVLVPVPGRESSTTTAQSTDARIRLRVQRQAVTIWTERKIRRRRGWRELIKRILGVEPSAVVFPIDNATRAASYHLQIAGPRRSFLSYQAIAGRDASLRSLRGIRVQRRHGQSVAHLRMRGGPGAKGLYYVVAFDERPPGSIAWAAVASFTASVLVAIAFLLGSSAADPSGVIAVLLSAPAFVGAWRGLGSNEQISGNSLASRISLLITLLSSVVASFFYVVDWSGAAPGSELVAWAVVLAVSIVNTAATVGAWLARESTEAMLTREGFKQLDATRLPKRVDLRAPGTGQWIVDGPTALPEAPTPQARLPLVEGDSLAVAWLSQQGWIRTQVSRLQHRRDGHRS